MPATNLAIRDKIARELQNRETLPWALENRKLFPNAIFGNNVKYSPLLLTGLLLTLQVTYRSVWTGETPIMRGGKAAHTEYRAS